MTKRLIGLGEVELVDCMGGDLSTVNSARISYDRRKYEMDSKDERLIEFLWDAGHTSPSRHSVLQFRILAPIFVLRQWMKHTVGCAWNERSGRYVVFELEHFEPQVIFEEDPKVKQGTGTIMEDDIGVKALMRQAFCDAFDNYRTLLECGVAREQARAVLPLGMLTSCMWTVSLQAVLHFLDQRLDDHAQYETRLFAKAVLELMVETGRFQVSLSVWVKGFVEQRPKLSTDPFFKSILERLC
jgi:thymidylate synthase (FAD)